MKTGNHGIHPDRTAAHTALFVILLLAGALPALAQTAAGRPSDLVFKIVNATTGQGAVPARLTIDYVTHRRNNMVDSQPADSTFTVAAVPVLESGKYIITVWYQGVPYWWSKRGRELTAGPVTLHVFDAVTEPDGVTVSGLNLVIRRQESLVRLEYMLHVDNMAKPQVTVTGSPATFQLALPNGATDINATYTRGPDPMPVPVSSPGKRSGLSVPLTPGQNLIRIEATVPWSQGLKIPVGSDLPISSWSVLASPESMKVGSTDIEENNREPVSGFRRYAGFPLKAGDIVTLRLKAGQAATGPTQNAFTREAPAARDEQAADKPAKKGGNMTLPLIFTGVVIIVILAAVRRRRS